MSILRFSHQSTIDMSTCSFFNEAHECLTLTANVSHQIQISGTKALISRIHNVIISAFVCVCVLFAVCKPGFYRSALQTRTCSKCPPHSFTKTEGSTSCQCEHGYYKKDTDPTNMACTSKYSVCFFVFRIQNKRKQLIIKP